MKKNCFDILENADDKIIEELVPYSSDDANTRKRVLNMSEKKYDKMSGNFETGFDDAEVVSGVDRYKRPVWYRTLCAAAAVALVIGGIGTFGFLNRDKFTSSKASQAARVSDTTMPSITKPPVTQPVTKTVLEINADDEKVYFNEEELGQRFEVCLNAYIDTVNFLTPQYVDPNAETLHFWRFHSIDENNDFDPAICKDMMKQGDELYYDETYYKLDSPNYSNLKELKDYYAQFFTDVDSVLWIGKDLSSYAPGSVIPVEVEGKRLDADIIEYNGALYTTMNQKTAYDLNKWETLCQNFYYYDPKSVIIERVYKAKEGVEDIVYYLTFKFVKADDGSYKVGGSSFSSDRYDPEKDYSSEKEPHFYEYAE